jgi:uroporphyrinogen decarboxylase
MPDRVPVDLSGRSSAIEAGAYADLTRYLGKEGQSPVNQNFIRSHAVISEEILDMFQVDTRYVRSVPLSSWKKDADGEYFIDSWQVPWKKAPGSHYYDIARFIHQDIEEDDIAHLQWPDLLTEAMADEITAKARNLTENTGYSVITDTFGSAIFETAWYMRGFEQFLVDMMTDEMFTMRYLDKILELQLTAYDKLLTKAGPIIDAVFITDDLASQDSLLMSNALYKRVIAPYQKELFSFIRKKGPEVIYHSCGAVYPLLEDLIETGVTVLHPVQLSAKGMDARKLKEEFGSRIVFWGGGCNAQQTLQFGSVAEVRDEVKARLSLLAPGGGYVFAPEHCIQPGTPPENIIAMFETVKAFGRYT